jgi:hypothetical protein
MISASLDALLRQRSSVEVMDYLRQLISPQIAIEKTPEISYSGQALARCISAYPNSRYLHLTRHSGYLAAVHG